MVRDGVANGHGRQADDDGCDGVAKGHAAGGHDGCDLHRVETRHTPRRGREQAPRAKRQVVAYRTREEKQSSFMPSLLCAPSAHSSLLGPAPTTAHKHDPTQPPMPRARAVTQRLRVSNLNHEIGPSRSAQPGWTFQSIVTLLTSLSWASVSGRTYANHRAVVMSRGLRNMRLNFVIERARGNLMFGARH